MASKGKGGITVNTVWDIAQPIAESLGLELWDVRFEKEGYESTQTQWTAVFQSTIALT